MMRRRDFITLLGGAAAWPLAAGAQQAIVKIPRIGFLSPSPQTYQEEFRRGLREVGYFEGQNVIIDYRFTGGNDERLIDAARELVRASVDVFVCTNSAATAAAVLPTSTIPTAMDAPYDAV